MRDAVNFGIVELVKCLLLMLVVEFAIVGEENGLQRWGLESACESHDGYEGRYRTKHFVIGY
jgi:hypothetical protein